MSSTNSTTHYELSQFVGSDKPAWLGDYNSDMAKIDAGVYSAQSTATGADGKADTNTNAIGTLTNLTTTEKSNLVGAINEVKTSAGTAQNTANTAVNTANTASLNVTALINKFALSATEYTNNDMSVTNGTLASNSKLYIAKNTDGSLFKVYGRVFVTLTSTGGSTIKISLSNTGISVDSQYQIICAGFAYDTGNIGQGLAPATLTIKNGSIDIEFVGRIQSNSQVVQLNPCLYFNSNFGDLPTPE